MNRDESAELLTESDVPMQGRNVGNGYRAVVGDFLYLKMGGLCHRGTVQIYKWCDPAGFQLCTTNRFVGGIRLLEGATE